MDLEERLSRIEERLARLEQRVEDIAEMIQRRNGYIKTMFSMIIAFICALITLIAIALR